MKANKQQVMDEAIIDHSKANDPDDKVLANYYRNQYNELLKQTNHANKERRRIDWISMLLCYTIYICCAVNSVVDLVSYDGGEWDSGQRLLWCIVLAMNVGFGVFVAMSRLLNKIERDRIDQSWNQTKSLLELKGKLDVAEHNLEIAEESNKVAAKEIVRLQTEIEKLKKKK